MRGYINNIDWLNIEPMKYWSFTAATDTETRRSIVKNCIFSGEYGGALKVDGYYQRLLKDEDGNCFMIARNRNVSGEIINKYEWVPQFHGWMQNLPNGTCLLAEIYFPNNEGSNKVTSILGCLKEKAILRQKDNPLHLYIFDCMALNGKNYIDTPYEERMQVIKQISNIYNHEYVEYAKMYDGQELWNNLQNYLASGREGMVIMRKDAKVYQKRTPARISIKVKKELKETIDVVIMGANPPTRLYNGKEILTWRYWEDIMTGEKLEGELYNRYSDGEPIEPVTKTYWNEWAGSLIIGVLKDDKVVTIGSLSGLTEEVLSNWQKYKGKVAEISGMQIMETGGIRHPKFVQWRDDLTVRDTDWYRIFGK